MFKTISHKSWMALAPALALGLLLAVQLAGSPAALSPLASLRASRDEARTAMTGADLRETQPSAEENNGAPLTAEMRAALNFVSRRYRVSAAALNPVFFAAQTAGRQMHLDPLLIVAVIAIESRFNPFAESVAGAQGLMQVMPRWHENKLPENSDRLTLFDPEVNVQIGAQVLRESIRRMGGLIPGLQQFGGAADDPDNSYASRVLAEKQRLEIAALRNKH
ncbi:MAG: transglycosylase SLT domain-containing protein [Betaproteobacteria bacterium]|nr:transglycosylase SLT domain-containing protein [Betaproteobacteria bacterium]